MGLPDMPISWGGARGLNVGGIYPRHSMYMEYMPTLTPLAPPQLIGIYVAVPWSVWDMAVPDWSCLGIHVASTFRSTPTSTLLSGVSGPVQRECDPSRWSDPDGP